MSLGKEALSITKQKYYNRSLIIPGYEDCDFAILCFGLSKLPLTISNGDILICKFTDWDRVANDIQFGTTYIGFTEDDPVFITIGNFIGSETSVGFFFQDEKKAENYTVKSIALVKAIVSTPSRINDNSDSINPTDTLGKQIETLQAELNRLEESKERIQNSDDIMDKIRKEEEMLKKALADQGEIAKKMQQKKPAQQIKKIK